MKGLRQGVLFQDKRLALKLYYYNLIPLGWDRGTRKKGGTRLRKPQVQRHGGLGTHGALGELGMTGS